MFFSITATATAGGGGGFGDMLCGRDDFMWWRDLFYFNRICIMLCCIFIFDRRGGVNM